jgi:hypothetical protein
VPISRIITRCSQDCGTIDGPFGQLSFFTTLMIMNLVVSFFTAIISSGWPSIPPAIIVAALVLSCAHLYINAQLPVKRNMSNDRAPILGHLSTTLNGIGACVIRPKPPLTSLSPSVSVRAYEAQVGFREKSLHLIDIYSRTAVSYWNLNR